MSSRAVGVMALLLPMHAAAQGTPDPGAPPPEKRICRMITPTGTMFPHRFCLTAAQWKEFNSINATSVDKALSGRMHGRLKVGDDGP